MLLNCFIARIKAKTARVLPLIKTLPLGLVVTVTVCIFCYRKELINVNCGQFPGVYG